MGISSIIALLAGAVLAPLIVITLCFALEVVFGLKRARVQNARAAGEVEIALLIPAHNEEAIIAQTLERLRESIANAVRISAKLLPRINLRCCKGKFTAGRERVTG